jgi:hypothetical protein
VHRLEDLARALGITLNDHTPVRYRAVTASRVCPAATSVRWPMPGRSGPGVSVFDTTLTTVGQRREGGLEGPASERWHGRAFFKAQLQG